ncbi:MAG: hypothetical protein LBI98_01685 [Endomicrobium sp.]|jgi:hypothetical protein|nr:hypothetical protein [Endomicrobium sp.]
MVANREKKISIWIKLYMIMLFLFGMSMCFSLQFVRKQKALMDVAIDEKIVNVLVLNGIIQDDILTQYVVERNIDIVRWNEFYKTIDLKSDKTVRFLEKKFRIIARSMKLGLGKVKNKDNSVTYKFYSPNKNYYNVTFIRSKNLN